MRERDGANVVRTRQAITARTTRSSNRPLTTNKPTMSPEERSAVQVALAGEVAEH